MDPGRARERVARMRQEGAEIIDIGGESTRPGASSVDAGSERARVLPLVRMIARDFPDLMISVDTSKASVARSALSEGAHMINDVRAAQGDPGMIPLLLETGAPCILMHMRGEPRTMQDNPVYEDVVAEVGGYLSSCRDHLVSRGYPAERVWLDPGIGFGKTLEHNLELLAGMGRLRALCSGTLAAHLFLDGAVDVLRTHEPGQTLRAMAVFRTLRKAKASSGNAD